MSYAYFPEWTNVGDVGVVQINRPGTYEINGVTFTGATRAFEGDEVYYTASAGVTGIKTRRSGVIAGVLLLNNTKKYGKNARGVPVYKMTPLSWKYPSFLVASSSREKTPVYVTIEFHQWNANQKYPQGALVRILGAGLEAAAEEQALRYKNDVFRKAVQMPEFAEIVEVEDRPTYGLEAGITCIDPEGSTDLDDAFHIAENRVYVHIADVDYYIKAGTPLDAVIKARATSIYGSTVSHMLPEKFSSDLISLLPNGRKAVLTVVLDQTLKGLSWHPAYAWTKRAISYDAAQKLLDAERDDQLREASRLTGETDTHKIIEKIMLACNAYIGGLMRPGLIRICKAGEMAQYVSSDMGQVLHETLDLEHYTHFTSPIRRYADVLVHRLLKGQRVDVPAECLALNQYNVKVKGFYRDYQLLQLYRYINEKGGLLNTEGTVIRCDGRLTLDLAIGFRYSMPDGGLVDTESKYVQGMVIPVILRTDSTQIRLNRKIIMHGIDS